MNEKQIVMASLCWLTLYFDNFRDESRRAIIDRHLHQLDALEHQLKLKEAIRDADQIRRAA